MSEQDVQNLRGAYDDFNAGNPQTVIGLMAADVEWTEPGGGNAAQGTFTGADSIGQEVFGIIEPNFDEFSVNPEEFQEQGDIVLVTGRFKGKNKSGAELDAPFEHVWQFEDGQITRMENKPEQEAWTAAWS